MSPGDGGGGLTADVLVQDLSESVERQTCHPVWIVVCQIHVDAGQESAVQFPPGHSVGQESFGAHGVRNSRPAQFVHGRWSVVRGSRLLVEFIRHVDDLDGDALFREEKTQEQAAWTGPRDDRPWLLRRR